MTSRIVLEKRGNRNRRRKPIFVIVAEGKNKTESLYFMSFQNQESPYVIKMVKAGKKTDPKSLVETAEKAWTDNDMDEELGDHAFVVVDIDNDSETAKKVASIQSKLMHAEIVASNPCFEVWFLMHFTGSTKQFMTSDAAVKELKKYIKDYEKNKNVFKVLEGKTATAINNAEKINKKYADEKANWISTDCNPRTDVVEVVKRLVKND